MHGAVSYILYFLTIRVTTIQFIRLMLCPQHQKTGNSKYTRILATRTDGTSLKGDK